MVVDPGVGSHRKVFLQRMIIRFEKCRTYRKVFTIGFHKIEEFLFVFGRFTSTLSMHLSHQYLTILKGSSTLAGFEPVI